MGPMILILGDEDPFGGTMGLMEAIQGDHGPHEPWAQIHISTAPLMLGPHNPHFIYLRGSGGTSHS